MAQASTCPVGSYGSLCDKPCPQRCEGQICSQNVGFCTVCEPGWRGLTCNKGCDTGRFGKGCEQICSYQCVRVSCDPVNGTCVGGCVKGFKPPDCNKQCNSGFHGFNCTEQCPQNCKAGCSASDGTCLQGCVPGYRGDRCDTVCDDTFYGEKCKHKCSQACVNSKCHPVNGSCTDCPPGKVGDQCERVCDDTFYGEKCKHKCSQACVNSKCHPVNGSCTDCPPGKVGDQCERVCDDTFYGEKCKHKCSQACVNSKCHPVNGSCTDCPPGKVGDQCERVCDDTFYGEKCKHKCSQACVNSKCHPVNGSCTDCPPGKVGDQCERVCDDTFYGEKCQQKCNQACVNSKCHPVNGLCTDCPPGKVGDQCERVCDDTFYGEKCKHKCSQACVNSKCHPVNGSCTDCPPGKVGDQCERECNFGTYGKGCSESCSQYCKGGQGCSSGNGDCFEGCTIGYRGSRCVEQCEKKTYGEGCKSNCSQFCFVDVKTDPTLCHFISGNCHSGCVQEYEGAQCAQLKQTFSGAVAVPIIVTLLLVVILVVGGLMWRRRKRATINNNVLSSVNSIHTSEYELPGTHQTITSGNQPAIHDGKASLYSNKNITQADNSKSGIYCSTSTETFNTAIAVQDLNTFMLSHTKEYFEEQFKKIPASIDISMAVGLSAENKNKNRYKNICPYDHSRVNLIVDGENCQSDYINASYIQGFNEKNKFIAAQGPNKFTVEDFVRMLWEQRSDVVVMLTNLVEEAKQKCEKYWPDEKEMVLGEIKVCLIDSQELSHCIIRKIRLKKSGQPVRQLTHFHFTAWPDKGVPENPWIVVEFEQRVSSHQTNRPIVVHCSAGVGRTGTFIALCNVMKEAQETGFMDFYTTLWKLRQDRINMIQTVGQYAFLHKIAQVALACLGTSVKTSDSIQRINYLQEISASGQTNMENEFKAVCDVCTNGDAVDEEGSGGNLGISHSSTNKQKNRFSNVLPKEFDRTHLFCESTEMGDYINAVSLPSLTSQKDQILTQLPLPGTVLDFWRLVTQFHVSCIVACEVDTEDSTIGAYLPSENNEVMHCGPFEIQEKSKQVFALWEEKVLSIKKTKKRKSGLSSSSTVHADGQPVTHIKCSKRDLDAENLLAVVKQVQLNSSRDKSKVLYMCRNGADYSGLLCVLSQLLDKMDSDHQLTVPLVVGTVKNVRPQVIPTLTIGHYLPDGDDTKTVSSLFNIKTNLVNTGPNWDVHRIVININSEQCRMTKADTMKEDHVTSCHILSHLTCKSTKLSSESLLAFMRQIRSMNPADGGRTLYMCRNGSECSGLVCTLSLLLDKVDVDQQVSVPLVVGRVKAIRPQIVSSLVRLNIIKIMGLKRFLNKVVNEVSNLIMSNKMLQKLLLQEYRQSILA